MDGPGGSGKTYLYKVLLSYVRGSNRTALAFATTGIASTLLRGGATMHSGFKLPIVMTETSSALLGRSTAQANQIIDAVLIVIDEASAMNRHSLRCIDKLLAELMEPDNQARAAFGRKVIILGGDFRHTLPIVPREKRARAIDTTIKAAAQWLFWL